MPSPGHDSQGKSVIKSDRPRSESPARHTSKRTVIEQSDTEQSPSGCSEGSLTSSSSLSLTAAMAMRSDDRTVGVQFEGSSGEYCRSGRQASA